MEEIFAMEKCLQNLKQLFDIKEVDIQRFQNCKVITSSAFPLFFFYFKQSVLLLHYIILSPVDLTVIFSQKQLKCSLVKILHSRSASNSSLSSFI